MSASPHGYGRLERLLHRVAFATTTAQCGLADLEERLFRRELAAIEPGPPAFITALPRAGTTILLELLAGAPPFASHTYRDMPFVLSPMLWSRLSRPFQRTSAPRERAHEDGIRITQDSPEAFEEVLWRRFWPSHYRADRIEPWSRCDEPAFVAFVRAHMRKIIALRARGRPGTRRYVSKNNLNVARIPALFAAFPDAVVLLPFREPLQHAWSLCRQHRRFGALHADDAFTRRYMADIGHYDFGANLRPVDFGGWLDRATARDAQQVAFWLEYWLATYRHVLRHAGRPGLHLLRFESLGHADLAPLAAALGLQDAQADDLRRRSAMLAGPPTRDVDASGVPPALLADAREVYAALATRALL
jgi:hypothetical protein